MKYPLLALCVYTLALLQLINLATSSGSNFPTRTNGLYCHVGMGMRRHISGLLLDSNVSPKETIEISSGSIVFCPGVSYCFEVSTSKKEVMEATFGGKIMDAEWDPYYNDFFARGCEGAYGTQSFPAVQRCPFDKEGSQLAGRSVLWNVVSQVYGKAEYVPPEYDDQGSLITQSPTVTPSVSASAEEVGAVVIPSEEFNVAYCCYNHFCSSAWSKFHSDVGAWLLILGGFVFGVVDFV